MQYSFEVIIVINDTENDYCFPDKLLDNLQVYWLKNGKCGLAVK